jgi:DNA-binding MarR family transcriptional regulator
MLDLDAFLPYRLAVLAAEVSRGLATVYEKRFDISIAEWRIIANLGRAGPLEAGTLAERSTLDKPKVTRALQRLERRGLVARRIPRDDRRRAVLALTPKGAELHAEIASLALAWEQHLLRGLTAEERAGLEGVIDRLTARARALRSP